MSVKVVNAVFDQEESVKDGAVRRVGLFVLGLLLTQLVAAQNELKTKLGGERRDVLKVQRLIRAARAQNESNCFLAALSYLWLRVIHKRQNEHIRVLGRLGFPALAVLALQ